MANEWQPIETAPTDGTRILLCTGSYSPEFVHLATWDGEHCHPYIPNRWTHWHPLPSPPSQAEPEANE